MSTGDLATFFEIRSSLRVGDEIIVFRRNGDLQIISTVVFIKVDQILCCPAFNAPWKEKLFAVRRAKDGTCAT
jgi:hypothetical protein